MRQRWSEAAKGLIRPWLFKLCHRGLPSFECPICGYRGPFKSKRTSRLPGQVREYAKCVRCGAAERHRLQSLVIDEFLGTWDASEKQILHVAPEFCLQPKLARLFGKYHTADLFRMDVDYKEDIQQMTFADASYDCVFVSRVLTNVPDYERAIREVRRILKPGGRAVFSESFLHETTRDLMSKEGNRFREMGLDLLDVMGKYFSRVHRIASDRYDARHQLMNRVRVGGQIKEGGPKSLCRPGIGYMELVAVCYT